MNDNILADVAREFSSLEFSEENESLAALRLELLQVEEKLIDADDRRSAIAREIHEYRGPSGHEVAKALLDGSSPTEAAKAGPDLHSLEQEKQALVAGCRTLRDRAEEIRAQIAAVEETARRKILPGAQRLEEMLVADALTLLEQLVPIYANLSALAATTRSAGNKIVNLRDVINAANGFEGFAGYRRDIEVSPTLNESLRHLDGKGPALRVGFLSVANL